MYTVKIYGGYAPVNIQPVNVDMTLLGAKRFATKWANEYGISSYGYTDFIGIRENGKTITVKINGMWI